MTQGVATAACATAARWPRERPASTASTGSFAPTRRAVRANLRGLPNDSRYSTASLVTSSCSHHISMSLLDTSSLLPTEANEEMPTPSRDSGRPGRRRPRRTATSARPRRAGAGWRRTWRPGRCRARPRRSSSGPDQPHAVPAAHREQVGAGGGVQAGGDHHERAHAALAALLGHVEHGRGGHRDDGQVDGLGQVERGGQAPARRRSDGPAGSPCTGGPRTRRGGCSPGLSGRSPPGAGWRRSPRPTRARRCAAGWPRPRSLSRSATAFR